MLSWKASCDDSTGAACCHGRASCGDGTGAVCCRGRRPVATALELCAVMEGVLWRRLRAVMEGRPVATALDLRAVMEGRPVATALDPRAVMEGRPVMTALELCAVTERRPVATALDLLAATEDSLWRQHWSAVPTTLVSCASCYRRGFSEEPRRPGWSAARQLRCRRSAEERDCVVTAAGAVCVW